jgi:hypothetical protein
MPDQFPDILRAPAVTYKPERDDTRIQANKYVAFARPYKGKQGLLLLGPEVRPLLIDESQPERCSVLPLRLDREAILETWVFAVSIYQAEGVIQLEDCIVCDGEQVRSSKTFKERFHILQRFCDSIWYPDKRFQMNWDVQVAQIHPLGSVRTALNDLQGGYLCLMPDSPTHRLLKVVPARGPTGGPVVAPKTGPGEFVCVPVLDKPDVYELQDGMGKEVGRASIQSLTMSQLMNQKRATERSWRVMAEWDADFESYIVTSVL